MKDTQYIEQFVNAITSVFGSISSRQINCKEIFRPSKDGCRDDILIIIGLVGDVSGNFYMSMNAQTGQIIASELLGGMEIEEGISELVTSAVSELGNMIMGNACSNISTLHVQVDITPPTVVIGDQITYSSLCSVYSIPVELEDLGTIAFDLALKSA